jgi:hypothetical protein
MCLCSRVNRSRRLVEDQASRIAHIGSCQSDLLPFAAREIAALAESFAKRLIVTQGQIGDNPCRKAALRGGLYLRGVIKEIDLSDGDILMRRHVVADEVLEDNPDMAAQLHEVEGFEVDSFDENAALIRPGSMGSRRF